jgi:hypothetical protein
MARSLFLAERLWLVNVLAMRTGHSNRTARLGAGIFLILALQGLCAPVSASAGCGHEVSSRADRTQSDLRVDGLLGEIAGPADPLQEPRPPCSGSWCSEHPAPPAAPLGLDDWASNPGPFWPPIPAPKLRLATSHPRSAFDSTPRIARPPCSTRPVAGRPSRTRSLRIRCGLVAQAGSAGA